MKKFTIFVLVIITAGLLLVAFPARAIDPLRYWGAEKLHALVLPLRIARLTASPAAETLLMPVLGAKVSTITDTWHAPRGNGRKHLGQDIFAKKGTPVVAVTDGFVMRIGTNGLGGNIIFVLGAGGHRYYYAHLDGYAPDLKPWQEVKAGDVLGYVGNTGNAAKTPPHLHFGMYTSSGPVNPLPFFENA